MSKTTDENNITLSGGGMKITPFMRPEFSIVIYKFTRAFVSLSEFSSRCIY